MDLQVFISSDKILGRQLRDFTGKSKMRVKKQRTLALWSNGFYAFQVILRLDSTKGLIIGRKIIHKTSLKKKENPFSSDVKYGF